MTWKSMKRSFGPYKAERLLYLSARTFAMADLGEREAWVDFYDAMLEVYLRKPANDGYVGPSVEDLRACEKTSLKQAFRWASLFVHFAVHVVISLKPYAGWSLRLSAQ